MSFTDYDGVNHPAGESWTYLTHFFLPYDNGLSLIVSLDGAQEWHVRLQDRPEEQGPVVRELPTYLTAARAPVSEVRRTLWHRLKDRLR